MIKDLFQKLKYLLLPLFILSLSGCLNNSTAPAAVAPNYSPIPFPSSYTRSSVNFNLSVNKNTSNLSYYHPTINKALKLFSEEDAWADASGLTYAIQNSFGSSLTVDTDGFAIPTTINPVVTSFGKISFPKITDSALNSCGGQRCTTVEVRAYFLNQLSAGLINSSTSKFAPVTVNGISVGLGSDNAVVLQKQYLSPTKNSLTQSDFVIPTTYEIGANFANLDAGTYQGNLVIDYVFLTETIPVQVPPVVTLTDFNAGGIIQGLSNQVITWTATSSNFYYEPITLEYSLDNGSTYSTIATGLTNSGTYNWIVPTIDSSTALIRVSAVDLNGNITRAVSTQSFIVDSTKPQILVNSFNNSDLYPGGATVTINWTATDLHLGSTPITLAYSSDNAETWLTITSGIANSGSYVWQIPVIDSQKMLVRVSAIDLAGNTNSANSGLFTVDSTSPTLSLLSLNGGDLIEGGSSQNILWSSVDTNFGINPIKLEYTSDDGVTWNPINTSISNTGMYSWLVPSIDSTTVKLRITSTDAVGHSTVVVSAADFEIDSTAPTLSLTSFNGGDYVKATTSQIISWNSFDKNLIAAPITIDLSTDDGTTWTNLTTGYANSGSFSWIVPNINSATCKMRISSTDAVGHITTVISASDFTISKGTPNSIQIVSGDTQTIPRSFTTPLSLKVLVLDINNQPARPGIPVIYSLLTGNGTFTAATVYTDNNGFAEAFYTTAAVVESASIKASTQREDLTTVSVQFTVNSANYSPTAVLTALTGELESTYFSLTDVGYTATYSPLGTGILISAPVLGGVSSSNGSVASISSTVTPTSSLAVYGANLTNLSDQITFTVNANYPSGVTSGTCQTISPITGLNNQTCTIASGSPDFSLLRSSITSNSSLKFRVFSASEGTLDYLDSSVFSLKYNSIRPVSNTNNGGSDGPPTTKPIIYDSKLYFSGNNAQGYSKLFAYNLNTNALTQISNTSGSASISDNVSEMIFYNNSLFFISEITPGNKKLYKYCDGSNCGTASLKQVTDMVSGGNDALAGLNLFNTSIYFKATTASGYVKLFKYCDFGLSCTGGLYQVADINPNATDSIGYLYYLNNYLFFSGKSTAGFNKLFRYCDGAGCGSQGVTQVSNIVSTGDDNISHLNSFLGNLMFSANIAANQSKLFEYNLSTGNINQLTDFNDGSNDSPALLTVNGTDFYFTATNSSGYTKLFKYNSVSAMAQVSNINTTGSDAFQGISIYNGEVFLSASNSAGFNKLFRLNTTTGILDQVSNLSSSAGDDIQSMIQVGTNLYFSGSASGNYKTYRYCEPTSGCTF
jgi:hypothetical protein